MSDNVQTDSEQPLETAAAADPAAAGTPTQGQGAAEGDWQAQVATLSAKNAELVDQLSAKS